MARRPDAASPPKLLTRHREAAPGAGTVYAVHPGALPAGLWAGLAGALPEETGFAVLDLGAVPEYGEAALAPERSRLTIHHLVDLLATAYRADRTGPTGRTGGGTVLVGWSFGGVLAHGLAGRLAPEEGPLGVVLLDSIAPTDAYQHTEGAPIDPAVVLRWFAMFLGARRGARVRPGPVPAGADTDTALALLLEDAITAGALPRETPLAGLRKLFEAYTAGLLRNNRLTAPYRPAPATVPLVQIKAADSLVASDPTLGWGELAGRGLTTHSVPGDHYTMLIRPDASQAIAGLVPPLRPAPLVTTRRPSP
ncbi:thioesterase domain-containing protein [Streptomyces sp. NPDC016626]|uniref:thioesterase domain-containing protein n=1 Tax=Streptomyces sp. NPDC016626 TaxID=3364968 RepID=UPI0036FBF7D1